jgi:hypothetical protein
MRSPAERASGLGLTLLTASLYVESEMASCILKIIGKMNVADIGIY